MAVTPASGRGLHAVPALAVALFAVAALGLFLLRAHAAIPLFEFGDESEKFVAAQMIEHGMRLYREVFAHHGPFLYLVSHLYAHLVDAADFGPLRWALVSLALIAALSIYRSPVLKGPAPRALATATFLALLSSVWALQGMHMLLYHPVGGLLFVVLAMQLYLPVLLGEAPTSAGLFAAGLAAVLACFTAYAFGPAVVLLTLATTAIAYARDGLDRLARIARPFLLGVGIGLVALVAWLVAFADLEGFLVFHLYFNQAVYAPFVHFGAHNLLNLLALSFAPASLIHGVAFVAMLGWLYLLAGELRASQAQMRGAWRWVALAALPLSIALLNPRGAIGFQDAGFVIANLATWSLVCGLVLQQRRAAANRYGPAAALVIAMLSVVTLELASDHAVSSPHQVEKADLGRHATLMRPADGRLYRFVRFMTRPDGDLLSLVFNPAFYILTGRTPASGIYYYLPWQAAYARDPVAGYELDLCGDIERRRPGVIRFDDWRVWGRYAIDDYEPCVKALLRTSYTALRDGSRLYLRNDRLVAPIDREVTPPGPAHLSRPLRAAEPLALMLDPRHLAGGGALTKIGVMLRFAPGQAFGDLELRLRGPGGIDQRARVLVSAADGDAYHYLDLPPARYDAAEIVGVAGDGIRVREGIDGSGRTLSCLSYGYADGRYAFTPGCPLY